jgi:hypothetical protein
MFKNNNQNKSAVATPRSARAESIISSLIFFENADGFRPIVLYRVIFFLRDLKAGADAALAITSGLAVSRAGFEDFANAVIAALLADIFRAARGQYGQ